MAQHPLDNDSAAPADGAGGRPQHVPDSELILVAHAVAGLRASGASLTSTSGADLDALSATLAQAGARLRPLFGEPEVRLQAHAASLSAAGVANVPDLSVYYRVEAPGAQLDLLAEKLRALDQVQAAYVKPGAEPPVTRDAPPALNAEAPAATPDFSTRQGYLDAAPGGVDARYAWSRSGGGGAGVGIIDVEGEWRFSHEDLGQNQGGLVAGAPPQDLGWRNHGCAVTGVFSGDRNSLGVTGICPEANVRAISIFGALGSSGAIRRAADMLTPGDIILIELHRPGPRFNFAGRADQRGYIAVEWWPDDYDAIRYAIARGVVVVEAGGNGAENLDDAVYDTPGAGFPAGWSNPFRRGGRDSGAIVVGAGAPPPGTHGRDYGSDRSRLAFSNYGALVDAQGWGREVTSTGYGDLQGGSNEDLWYTDQFSGTSSASPVVVGTLGCVQGFLRAGGRAPLTPALARNLLRSTGSPQQAGPNGPASQRIGNRPDLRQMIEKLAPTAPVRVPLHRYWNPDATDHFYTTDWNELGFGRYGWQYEGIQAHVLATAAPGTVPLYRYWNAGNGDHFYTTNWGELGNGRYGWAYEGVQCHVLSTAAPGSLPLYRYWNGAVGDHFYTTNWNELGNGRYGWAYEGVQCHVFANAVSDTPTTDEQHGAAHDEQAHASVAPSFAGVAALGQVPASFAGAAAGRPTPAYAGLAGAAPTPAFAGMAGATPSFAGMAGTAGTAAMPSFAGGPAAGQTPASFAARGSGQTPASFGARGPDQAPPSFAAGTPAHGASAPGTSFVTTTHAGAPREDDDTLVHVTVRAGR